MEKSVEKVESKKLVPKFYHFYVNRMVCLINFPATFEEQKTLPNVKWKDKYFCFLLCSSLFSCKDAREKKLKSALFF